MNDSHPQVGLPSNCSVILVAVPTQSSWFNNPNNALSLLVDMGPTWAAYLLFALVILGFAAVCMITLAMLVMGVLRGWR